MLRAEQAKLRLLIQEKILKDKVLLKKIAKTEDDLEERGKSDAVSYDPKIVSGDDDKKA